MATLPTREWFSTSQAARRLGLSASRLRQLTVVEGRLPYTQTPLGKLIAAEDLTRFAQERGRQGPSDAAEEGNDASA
jgi:hypothetical protein